MAVATSASGALLIEARTPDGEPPGRGVNAFDIGVVRTDTGESFDGLDLSLTPWMPAMGHGTVVRPVVAALGGGHYRADNVYLFMPGLWELRLSITGPLEDDAAPRFQIP
jgi:hypothetical protein